jgi:site-specific DNA-methyltransferase (adenine-specific)
MESGKKWDLAVVDPPYGINADIKNSKRELKSKKSAAISRDFGGQIWDESIPNAKYFDLLKSITKNQIIWGANYFGLIGGMLYWHKNVTMPTYSTGELAWLSFQNKIDFVDYTWHGMLQQNMKNKEIRQHPTQKPIDLYRWILQKYAKAGDTILDTHGGSMSSAIACDMEGFELDICEMDKEYFDKAVQRFKIYEQQQKLF